uniref:Putative tick transposon n=1 Tax=Ixodes ricinus TaxID=34613 RepID=A0A6B0V920_IXORI
MNSINAALSLSLSHPVVSRILTAFNACFAPLNFTFELPEHDSIRFLDLRLRFVDDHVCWVYEPRANKPPLPYSSAHSKLVKRNIVLSFLSNALRKSCWHALDESLGKQVGRLEAAGYPRQVIVSVAEGLHRKRKIESSLSDEQKADNQGKDKERRAKEKIAVIPYVHKISHNLKKVGQRSGVKVLFTAPNKLLALCRLSCPTRAQKPICAIKHRDAFVKCRRSVVYKIPLSCGKHYIGQTGRCLNVRLLEHKNKVGSVATDGHLAAHCKRCVSGNQCHPLYKQTTILYFHRSGLTREIVEAAEIARSGNQCVSRPSVALSKIELEFLSWAARHFSSLALF